MSNPIWKREEKFQSFSFPNWKAHMQEDQKFDLPCWEDFEKFQIPVSEEVEKQIDNTLGLVKLQLRLQQDLYEKLVRLAEYQGKNLQVFIRDILQIETTK